MYFCDTTKNRQDTWTCPGKRIKITHQTFNSIHICLSNHLCILDYPWSFYRWNKSNLNPQQQKHNKFQLATSFKSFLLQSWIIFFSLGDVCGQFFWWISNFNSLGPNKTIGPQRWDLGTETSHGIHRGFAMIPPGEKKSGDAMGFSCESWVSPVGFFRKQNVVGNKTRLTIPKYRCNIYVWNLQLDMILVKKHIHNIKEHIRMISVRKNTLGYILRFASRPRKVGSFDFQLGGKTTCYTVLFGITCGWLFLAYKINRKELSPRR